VSHISKIEVEIQSLEDLKAACQELGFRFMENQKTHKWYGTNRGSENDGQKDLGKCDHAIKVPKCKYEIGIVKNGNHYNLLWDSYYTGGLEERIGKDAGLLKQAYSVQRIKREARIKGYRVLQKKVTNGIRLVLSF
jgi:hypothetical protein